MELPEVKVVTSPVGVAVHDGVNTISHQTATIDSASARGGGGDLPCGVAAHNASRIPPHQTATKGRASARGGGGDLPCGVAAHDASPILPHQTTAIGSAIGSASARGGGGDLPCGVAAHDASQIIPHQTTAIGRVIARGGDIHIDTHQPHIFDLSAATRQPKKTAVATTGVHIEIHDGMAVTIQAACEASGIIPHRHPAGARGLARG